MAKPPKHNAAQLPESRLLKGRLKDGPDAFVGRFTASIGFDYRLAPFDLALSRAHVRMLERIAALNEAECKQILGGLDQIEKELEGDFKWSFALEDVHMNIEHRLIELVGEVGKKLHTARSRNDQVATGMRLYLRAEIDILSGLLWMLAKALLTLAEHHTHSIMPGFTHLQTAQPVTFGHHMLAWESMLERDLERLWDCRARVNRLPLGTAALAGTSFPVDRQFVADALGFEGLCPNSLDAVSDRDFVIEFCSVAAILMMHFSRWSEELILWSSSAFGFIRLPDRFCTGSSMMPQKKNPDVPELIRGKSGRVFGQLMAMLTLMKGQPLAYNKDNQEDKEPLFDAVDTVQDCARALAEMMPHVEPDLARMNEAAGRDGALATDLAEYLARKGVPFRAAHDLVGALIAQTMKSGRELADFSLEELQAASPKIEADIFAVLTIEGSVAAKSHLGGTAPDTVQAAAKAARARLDRLDQTWAGARQRERAHAG